MNLQEQLNPYLDLIEKELRVVEGDSKVTFFYDPIHYVLDLQGKRIRPLLTILTARIFGIEQQISRFAGVAVELLHNFTLVHDDIMDNDELRRGKPTVHVKWDLSAAILAGDGLMGLAFQKLLQSPSGDVAAMARRFTEAMIEICEGQGQDKMFEKIGAISSEDYLEMIARKTAVLIELSCELGARVSEVSEDEINKCRELGYALGLGFQIQDDVLDIIGSQEEIGKKVGSDLQMRKQTLITILLREKMGSDDFYNKTVDEFREYLDQYGVLEEVKKRYNDHFATADRIIGNLPQNEATGMLRTFVESIKNRKW